MRKNSNFLRHLTLNLCLIFLVGFLSSNLWAEKKQLPTINQQEAIDAAIAMTVFDRLPDISIKAQHEVLEQDNTPVIGSEIANCPIWRITFYDVEGQLVRKINLGDMPAGIYTSQDRAVYWDGCNQSGERVSSGLYFYQLQAGEYSTTLSH